MALLNLDKLKVKDKLVLIRIDINSPVVKGKIQESPRFKEHLITITELLDKEAKLVILAHQGRSRDNDFLQLKQHADILKKYLPKKIDYYPDLFGSKSIKKIKSLKSGKALLLENVRAYTDEMEIKDKNNRYPSLCKLFDLYINDAFSASHREQGSIIIPPKYLKSFIGRSFEKEVNFLKNFNINSKEKKVFLLGGSKVEDYISMFDVLKNKSNTILASGVFANLILISQGRNLGYENIWAAEQGYLTILPVLKENYSRYSSQIMLPSDFAFGDVKRIEKPLNNAPFDSKIWDVGKMTLLSFKKKISESKVVFMKGPLGFSEIDQFSYSTVEILKYISYLTKNKSVFSLIGGGHLTTTIEKYSILSNFSYISLSGGALLQYLSGKKLPGIIAIENSPL